MSAYQRSNYFIAALLEHVLCLGTQQKGIVSKKRIISLFSLLAVVLPVVASSSAFAIAENSDIDVSAPSKVIVQREDVSLRDALHDSTFVPSFNNVASVEANVSDTRALKWKVWGSRKQVSYTNSWIPIGYSKLLNGTTVVKFYHYTRTFLGRAFDPRGDSGRQWGFYTVQATGTACDQGVWDAYIHRVYYGVTS